MKKILTKTPRGPIAPLRASEFRRASISHANSQNGLNAKRIFLAIYFLMSFNVFQYFPGYQVPREGWLVFLAIYLFVIFIGKEFGARRWPFSSFETYVLGLILVMPVYSAWMAYQEFGQPLLYGVLTQRTTMLSGATILVIYWVERKRISLSDVESVLVWLGWITLIGYVALNGLLNPASFSDYVGFVGGGAIEPYHFILKSVFIKFAIFYYVVRGVRQQRLADIIKILPFVIYLIFIDGGRSLMLSVLAASLIAVFQAASFVRLVVWAPAATILFAIIVSSMFYFQSDYMERLEGRFDAAATVVLSGEKSSDVSANARIEEVKLAGPYIEKNWLFGSGDLSVRWNNGYLAKVGRFSPSDIGVIGNLFVFGVVGVIIYLFQFLYARRFVRKTPKDHRTTLVEASKVYLIYVLIHSMATGAFIYDAQISLMFAGLLYLGAASVANMVPAHLATRRSAAIKS